MGAVLRMAATVAVLALGTTAAMADDWIAVRLRGVVLQLVDEQWTPLRRGDVVPDSRVIRTLQLGSVEFERGTEHVTVGPNSAIQIYDEARKRPFTTVKQYFGTVTVEADVEDVQHFAVQNNYLAAVVKGTIFTVTADEDGASVAVKRGSVFVADKASGNSTTVGEGETAAVDKDHREPSVTDRNGKPVDKAGKGKPEDKPGKGKPADTPGKGKPEDKTNNGKSGAKSDNGKSGDDDPSGHGKSGTSGDDNSGKGNNGADNSGKGKSGRDDT